MIYIANGIYSDVSPNEYLAHYGVLGMKWGVHRARAHEKNLYRSNYLSKTMSKANAKKAYKERMVKIKETAKKNKHTDKKVSDIWKPSYNKAKKTIKDYDKKRQEQKLNNTVIGLGLVGGAGLLGDAVYRKYGKPTRETQKIANGQYNTNAFTRSLAKGALNSNRAEIKDDLTYAALGLGSAGAAALTNASLTWGQRNKSDNKKKKKKNK